MKMKKVVNSLEAQISKDDLDDGKYFDMFREKRIKASKNIILITLMGIGLFLAVGMSFDYFVGTKPFGTLALLILSFPVTQFVIFRVLKKKFN